MATVSPNSIWMVVEVTGARSKGQSSRSRGRCTARSQACRMGRGCACLWGGGAGCGEEGAAGPLQRERLGGASPPVQAIAQTVRRAHGGRMGIARPRAQTCSSLFPLALVTLTSRAPLACPSARVGRSRGGGRHDGKRALTKAARHGTHMRPPNTRKQPPATAHHPGSNPPARRAPGAAAPLLSHSWRSRPACPAAPQSQCPHAERLRRGW